MKSIFDAFREDLIERAHHDKSTFLDKIILFLSEFEEVVPYPQEEALRLLTFFQEEIGEKPGRAEYGMYLAAKANVSALTGQWLLSSQEEQQVLQANQWKDNRMQAFVVDSTAWARMVNYGETDPLYQQYAELLNNLKGYIDDLIDLSIDTDNKPHLQSYRFMHEQLSSMTPSSPSMGM